MIMDMAQSFSWQTADNLKIYAVDWPCEEPRAVVGIVHGLGEHIHRYEHVAAWFNQHKIAVVGYDRRGHGQSEGKRGHTPKFSAFLDEIAQLAVEIELRYPDLPLFLYGHSMGGNLVLNYTLRRHPTIAGVIATGPHIRLSFQPNVVTLGLGKMMRGILPGFTQSNGLDVQQLSRDPQVVKDYQADPLVHDRLTASTGISMLEAAAELDAFTGEFPVPLLLMHGSKDGITSPDGTHDFAERVYGNIQLKIWDGLYHEIHNEPEQEEVLQVVTDWINDHLAGLSAKPKVVE